jgi:hypothetical protein
LILHDAGLQEIFQKLRPLLEPSLAPAKTEIGFHVKEAALPYRVSKKLVGGPRASAILSEPI